MTDENFTLVLYGFDSTHCAIAVNMLTAASFFIDWYTYLFVYLCTKFVRVCCAWRNICSPFSRVEIHFDIDL